MVRSQKSKRIWVGRERGINRRDATEKERNRENVREREKIRETNVPVAEYLYAPVGWFGVGSAD